MVFTVIFVSNPTSVLRLCCDVIGVVTKLDELSCLNKLSRVGGSVAGKMRNKAQLS